MIRADELTNPDDKLLLEAQRAAQRDDWGAVAAAADEVLKNDPARAEAMFLAGLALQRSGNEGMAALMYRGAANREPNKHAPWLQLAMCLHERHPKEAYRAAIKAQSLKADDHQGLSALCNIASTLGRHAEAIEWAERAEKLYGLNGEVSHNKSFALMALGRWEEGWRDFKASLGLPNRAARNYHKGRETPRWNPARHENAVVAIYGEQGIGDEIMYASMIDKAIAAAAAKGSRVVIECWARNADLFRRSFPDAKVYGTLKEQYSEWPADEGVTHRLEMGGLGEFFAREPFRRSAFLHADVARKAASRAWLDHARAMGMGERSRVVSEARKAKPVVGISWTGGSWETGRGRRSIPFEQFLQITRGQNATFVNLEYEDRRADLEFAPDILNPHWATRKGADMDDLAALVSNLDLVIAVQTSVVDLCGALGVPCWAITDEVPQWRYTGFFGDDTMGFYESVKVYRQKEWGDWGNVIQRISRDLAAFTEAKNPKPKTNGAAHESPANDAWVSC